MNRVQVEVAVVLAALVGLAACGSYPESADVTPSGTTIVSSSNLQMTFSVNQAQNAQWLTANPTNMPSVSLTEITETSSIDPTIQFELSPNPLQHSYSPNGFWFAKVVSFHYDPSVENEVLEIYNESGELVYSVDGGQREFRDPQEYLAIKQWSQDGNYLYFYYRYTADGGYSYFDGFGLYRVNLSTGNTETLLRNEGLVSHGVSPDGEKIAYIEQSEFPLMIHILEVNTGEELVTTIDSPDVEEEQAGKITWSPSGRYIAFISFQESTLPEFINVIDIQSMEITTYLTDKLIYYGDIIWTQEATILIESFNGNRSFLINASTQMAEQIFTPTPTPDN